MQKDTIREVFILDEDEINELDRDKKRVERPFADADELIRDSVQLISFYDAYWPDELYPYDDEAYRIRRQVAYENKQRARQVANGVLRVVLPNLSSTQIQEQLDAELPAILDYK